MSLNLKSNNYGWRDAEFDVLTEFLTISRFGMLQTELATPDLYSFLPFSFSVKDGDLYLTSHLSAHSPQGINLRKSKMATVVIIGPNAYISTKHYNSG